ncbi:SDR family oxidoreductase [Mesorhizobium sp. M0701]|uniref:SDR family oxidoreductase n=1 Tax=Mesorhizobium sp. M0701 TaxID=2956989 RepID=UPI00333A448A
MDMGLEGKKAIICAGSAGLGRACAMALAGEGVDVTINGRGLERLNSAAEDIRRLGKGSVTIVASDVTTDAGRDELVSACPDPDILVTNAGGPKVGSFRNFTRQDWDEGLNMAMLTHIDMIKRVIDGMTSRKWGRIINVTSSATKGAVPGFDLTNGARTGLTGFVAGLAREVIGDGVTVNNLLPGFFETDRLHEGFRELAKRQEITVDQARSDRLSGIPAKRFGQPEELGAACLYLASQHAGYITGQNLLLDGGRYPGTF